MQRYGLVRQMVLFLVVVVISMPFLIPFGWLASTAFKASANIFAPSLDFIPRPPTLEQFRRVLREFHFFMYLRNTVIITLCAVTGAVLSSCPVAYAFSRLEWPDRKLVFGLLMMTLMLPPQVTMIPIFLLFRELGWIDTFLPLIVPFFLGNAFYIFLLRQFFMGLPSALIESARMDGATEPRILVTVVMPLARPAILTVVLFCGIANWNDFVGPLIYLSSEEKKTLALGLQTLVGRYASEWGMLMAASLLMALPVILIFLLAQKQFIQGITMSGMKA